MEIPATSALSLLTAATQAYSIQPLLQTQPIASTADTSLVGNDATNIFSSGSLGAGQFLGSVIQALQQSGVNLLGISTSSNPSAQVQNTQDSLNAFVSSLFQTLSQQNANYPLGLQPNLLGINAFDNTNTGLGFLGSIAANGFNSRDQVLLLETQTLSQLLSASATSSNPVLSELETTFQNLVNAISGNSTTDSNQPTGTSDSQPNLTAFVDALSQYLGIGTPFSRLGNLISVLA